MKKGTFEHRETCRLCRGDDLTLFLDLGLIPLAGDYLLKEELGKEKYYPLRVYFCQNCFCVQLIDVVSSDHIFRNYRYLSSISLSSHFEDFAYEMQKRFLRASAFVVEIGSNDGVLLAKLQKYGVKVLGVDPALNVARIAQAKGIETLPDFFTEKKALEIMKKYGQADAIFANNVLAHIDDMHDVAKGVSHLLKPSGIFVFEAHYVLDLIEKLQYDFMYPGEHLIYYSLLSLIPFWEKYDFSIFDVKRIPIHSGSIRVYMQKKKKLRRATKYVNELILQEEAFRLNTIYPFMAFASKVYKHRKKLLAFITNLKRKNKKIVGYGAAGRGNTLLNLCGITPSILDYVVDESPERYGRFIPGVHIPIVKPEIFRKDNPDYALLLAWSYKDTILKKEKEFLKRGEKFIIPLPIIQIVP